MSVQGINISNTYTYEVTGFSSSSGINVHSKGGSPAFTNFSNYIQISLYKSNVHKITIKKDLYLCLHLNSSGTYPGVLYIGDSNIATSNFRVLLANDATSTIGNGVAAFCGIFNPQIFYISNSGTGTGYGLVLCTL